MKRWNGALDETVLAVDAASHYLHSIAQESSYRLCSRPALEQSPRGWIIHRMDVVRHVVVQCEFLCEDANEQVTSAIVEVADLLLKLADLRAAQRRHVLGCGCRRSG